MAVHGALMAAADSVQAKVGYLVSIRGAQLYVPRLDDIAADLEIEAVCMAHNDNNILYQFRISAAGKLLLEGRAAVVLNAEALIGNAS
jgi:predicted hotdog family 3-hydroxylacyl-ACP dehydratase